MARKLRIEFPGAIYHVTCRMLGDERSRLFVDDADRERFLDRLSERVEQYNIRLYMFVLMRNHFHLVFETPDGNCSKFMQALATAYTVYYNLRHRRHGHLMDGRYKAKLVEGDEYLLALSRYVHLNPVMIKSAKTMLLKERIDYLRQYRWSSYQGYINKRKLLKYVDHAPVLGEMTGAKKDWPRRYKEYVETGLAESDDDFRHVLKRCPLSIGTEDFTSWAGKLYRELIDGHGEPEDVSFRRMSEELEADEVMVILAHVFSVDIEEFRKRRWNSPLRAIAATYLMKYAGRSQRQAAEHLGMRSGSAINKQLLRHKEMLTEDRRLIKLLRKSENLLDQKRDPSK
jgi:putative transposase